MAAKPEKGKRYVFDGMTLDIPMYFDERSQQYLEDHTDLIENPVCTPQGRPVLLAFEDACGRVETAKQPPERIDCSDCIYFRRVEDALFGVCEHPDRRQINLLSREAKTT